MGAEDMLQGMGQGGGEDAPDAAGSVLGKGREILLPEKGNPFQRGDKPFARAGTPAGDRSAAEAALDARDLSPEDIAALFPSKHEDRQPPKPAAPAPDMPRQTLAPRPSARPVPPVQPRPVQPMPAPAVVAPTPAAAPAQPAAIPQAPARDAGGATIAEAPFRPTTPDADKQLVADVVPPVPPDPLLLKLLVTDDKIQMLMLRIDQAEARAIQRAGGDRNAAKQNLNQIEAARNLMLGGRANYEDAEREIGEVEARLEVVVKVKRWSYTFGLGILAYDLLWLFLLYLGVRGTDAVLKLAPAGFDARVVWVAILSGGLGGVTGSLYNLWVHIAKEQDFDPQHLMWYITNPIMGAVLGIFVFLVVVGGAVAISTGTLDEKSLGVIALLAWLCGFQQNVAYELVERALAVFRKPKEPAAAPGVTPAGATTATAETK